MSAKTIAQELDEALANVAIVSTKLAEATCAITAHGETIAKLQDELAVARDTIAKGEAVMAAERDARAAAEKALAQANELLANPAHERAGATGDTAPSGAVAAQTIKTRAELLAEYNKITSPKAREEFRNSHKAELGL